MHFCVMHPVACENMWNRIMYDGCMHDQTSDDYLRFIGGLIMAVEETLNANLSRNTKWVSNENENVL